MTNIAIIEDDKGLNNSIVIALKQEDYCLTGQDKKRRIVTKCTKKEL